MFENEVILKEETYKENNKKRVFISGPISNDPDFMNHFEEAQKTLEAYGYRVVNPAKINSVNSEELFTYEEYLKIDIMYLSMCDYIYMLDGWQNSNGAKNELKYALNNNIEPLTPVKIITFTTNNNILKEKSKIMESSVALYCNGEECVENYIYTNK